MIENIFYVIAFDSTHYAIRTEKMLKQKIKVDMIPTPREISVSCGLSVKFSIDDIDKVQEELITYDKNGLHLFKLTKVEQGVRTAEKIEWSS